MAKQPDFRDIISNLRKQLETASTEATNKSAWWDHIDPIFFYSIHTANYASCGLFLRALKLKHTVYELNISEARVKTTDGPEVNKIIDNLIEELSTTNLWLVKDKITVHKKFIWDKLFVSEDAVLQIDAFITDKLLGCVTLIYLTINKQQIEKAKHILEKYLDLDKC